MCSGSVEGTTQKARTYNVSGMIYFQAITKPGYHVYFVRMKLSKINLSLCF